VMCDNVLAVEISPPSFKALVIYMFTCVAGLGGIALFVLTINYILNLRSARTTKEVVNFFPVEVTRFFRVILSPCGKRVRKPLLELTDLEEKKSLLSVEQSDYDDYE